MAQIGVHDDDEIAGRMFDAVNVSGPESQFRCPRAQHDLLLSIDLLQLPGYFQRSVWTCVIDYNNFIVVVAVERNYPVALRGTRHNC